MLAFVIITGKHISVVVVEISTGVIRDADLPIRYDVVVREICLQRPVSIGQRRGISKRSTISSSANTKSRLNIAFTLVKLITSLDKKLEHTRKTPSTSKRSRSSSLITRFLDNGPVCKKIDCSARFHLFWFNTDRCHIGYLP